MYRLSKKALSLSPYDPIEGDYPIRLDANESFLRPYEADRRRMTEAAAAVALRRYPDPAAACALEAFAALYQVDPELVTAGNGSDELIALIMSVFLEKGETLLTLSPDFSMYQINSIITENPCLALEKEKDLTVNVDTVIQTIKEQNVRMLMFSNPCNPTSLGLSREKVRRILRETEALIVLDEAYMDFFGQSLLGEVDEYDNLIILRTTSKVLV